MTPTHQTDPQLPVREGNPFLARRLMALGALALTTLVIAVPGVRGTVGEVVGSIGHRVGQALATPDEYQSSGQRAPEHQVDIPGMQPPLDR